MSNITLNQIISFFTPNIGEKNQVYVLDQYETQKSGKFSELFKKVFSNNIYRYGIVQKSQNKSSGEAQHGPGRARKTNV